MPSHRLCISSVANTSSALCRVGGWRMQHQGPLDSIEPCVISLGGFMLSSLLHLQVQNGLHHLGALR